MKNVAAKRLTAVLFLFFLLVSTTGVFAAEKNIQHVYDQASLFSADAILEMEEHLAAVCASTGMDFVVVTTKDAQGKNAIDYADDFYDTHHFGTGEEYDGALFLIDMDNREAAISTSGRMIDILTDDRIDRILDGAYTPLSDGDYAGAAFFYIESIPIYTKAGVPSDQYRQDEETADSSSTPQSTAEINSAPTKPTAPVKPVKAEKEPYSVKPEYAAIFAVISLGVGGGCCLLVRAKYHMKLFGYHYPYQDKGRVAMTRSEDIFLNKNVTSRRIRQAPAPTHTSSSSRNSSSRSSSRSTTGRSTTRTSSSGRTHGGKSRKF